jgi:hypothetical protein
MRMKITQCSDPPGWFLEQTNHEGRLVYARLFTTWGELMKWMQGRWT